MFRPRFFETMKTYSKEKFFNDLIAGTIVGIVAIPLAVAFAIASGVSPEKGLFTAIIAGFLISLLGGSNVQIGGPTGAFIVIVYGIVSKYGVDGLIVATLIAGVILVIMGLIKLGTVIQFIPHPVIVGFTSGIAVIIFSSQINDLLGLGIKKVPAEFIEKWISFFHNIQHINLWAVIIGAGTILLIILLQKVNKKIPGSLFALIMATLAVLIFKIPVETIGTRFGSIPSSLPVPVFPSISLPMIRDLIFPAFTIAMLAGIESLLSAVVADGMTGNKHHSNTELIAQGIANIGSALFGGIPTTGAIARTATNIKNGGKTPVAGIIHAVVLLLVLLFLGNFAKLIPLSCLAGILIIVAYNMSEWRVFKALLKCPKSDVLVLLVTFSFTILLDLTLAISVGIILALLLFMRKMNITSNISVRKDEYQDDTEISDPFSQSKIEIPKDVEIYEISGPFFFGAAEKFKDQMIHLENPPKVRIIQMKNVPTIDSSGIKLLEDLYHDSFKHKTSMLLTGVKPHVLQSIKKAGFIKLIGSENILENIISAVARSKVILGINEPTLIDKLSRGGVHYDIEGDTPYDFIPGAVEELKLNPATHKERLIESLIEREKLMFTSIGRGIALPHSRNPVVKHADEEFVAVCYLKNGIDYQAPDNQPVHTAIMIVSASPKSHLETISKIARLCNNPKFVDLLKNRKSLDDIIGFIRQN